MDFKVFINGEFTEKARRIFAKMLQEQDKVVGPYDNKIDRCKIVCLVCEHDKPVAVGAIKIKTDWDFDKNKSGLDDLRNDFNWELGYIYTKPEYEGKGLAQKVIKYLIDELGPENLMASTEFTKNPGMVKILDKSGFKHYGSTWESIIHGHELGLFLKYI
ncbi:MAG: GNAT family N-acetyltransferase [Desulfobacteraceae bacterium]|nr:GNAT family N-acetyltransferase [Desulfobacteraceae bacterium]